MTTPTSIVTSTSIIANTGIVAPIFMVAPTLIGAPYLYCCLYLNCRPLSLWSLLPMLSLITPTSIYTVIMCVLSCVVTSMVRCYPILPQCWSSASAAWSWPRACVRRAPRMRAAQPPPRPRAAAPARRGSPHDIYLFEELLLASYVEVKPNMFRHVTSRRSKKTS